MKISRIFSIDLELVLLLKKEKNQSQIMNGLLRSYYEKELKEKKNA